MIIWYRNSFLASVVSILGCSLALFGITDLVQGSHSMPVPVAIILIAAGIGFVTLGRIISDRKAAKKQAAANQSSSAARAGQTYARNSTEYPQPASSPVSGKRVGFSAIAAGFCFLLALAYIIWTCQRFYEMYYYQRVPFWYMLEFGALAVLGIASFVTRGTQRVTFLHTLGFGALAGRFAWQAWDYYNYFGLDSFTAADGSTHYALTLVPLILAGTYAVMTLLAIFSGKNAKKRMGGIVRVLWLLPVLALGLVVAKHFSDYERFIIDDGPLKHGLLYFKFPHPYVVEALYNIFITLATLLTGIAFSRICKKFAEPQQPYYAPSTPQTAPAYTAPVHTQTSAGYASEPAPRHTPEPAPRHTPEPAPRHTPEPAPRHTPEPAPEPQPQYRPEPTQHSAPAQNTEMQKKIAAYKDLLDCGILSQEEYDEKIRELKRG